MSSGHPPTRPCRLALVLAASLGLPLLAGCNRDHYDEHLDYPVRSDLLVRQDETWGDLQPTGFNRPGVLPLDAIRLPENERPADSAKLQGVIGKKLFDPTKIPDADRTEYAKQMTEMFGTPAHPKVSGFEPAALKAVDESLTGDQVVKTLKLDEATLAEGSRHYRIHCLHCHGLEGNGRGPTGPWVNPPPRDYRQGIFKYTSSAQGQNERKPRRDDLLHVLTFGIEGTSMPSFNVLSADEREKLASYVIHLSMRGEVEFLTMISQLRLMAESKGAEATDRPRFEAPLREDVKNPTLKQALEDNLALISGRWVAAQKPDMAVTPEPYTYANGDDDFLKSAARGGKIFLGVGGCISCHQNFGREANLSYDSWGTIVRGRNLYEGIFRGGRRPIDLYFRVHGGINGAGMTSYKDLKTLINPQDLGITAEELARTDPLWDIVNFLRALPYRDVRDKLRGEPYKINLPE